MALSTYFDHAYDFSSTGSDLTDLVGALDGTLNDGTLNVSTNGDEAVDFVSATDGIDTGETFAPTTAITMVSAFRTENAASSGRDGCVLGRTQPFGGGSPFVVAFFTPNATTDIWDASFKIGTDLGVFDTIDYATELSDNTDYLCVCRFEINASWTLRIYTRTDIGDAWSLVGSEVSGTPPATGVLDTPASGWHIGYSDLNAIALEGWVYTAGFDNSYWSDSKVTDFLSDYYDILETHAGGGVIVELLSINQNQRGGMNLASGGMQT